MLCDFFKTVSTKRGFTKEYSDFVSGQIFTKITLRVFAFKIKAFISLVSFYRFTIFEIMKCYDNYIKDALSGKNDEKCF